MSARTFALPDLGEGLTEAEVVRWLVAAGDTVAVDQAVVEVETAKATVEVPTPYGGVVTELSAAEGEVVDVGAALLVVDDAPAESAPDAPEARRYVEEERAGSGNVLVGYGTAEPVRRGRRRPARRSAAPAAASTTVPAGSSGNASGTTRPLVISPVVRRLARDHGVDLTRLTGSAAGGVITRADVEQAIKSGEKTAPAAPETVPAAPAVAPAVAPEPSLPAPVRERVPLRGARQAAAEVFSRSRREIPEATTWVDVDATDLVALREQLNARRPDRPIGLLALLARFTVAGLTRHPELNSRVTGAEIVRFDGVNLGLAAQTDRGLVVPVVRDAHRLSARELHGEIARLTAAAREGGLTAADLTGGTFTLNNYGVFGVDGSAPIINHPEAAILGVGRIVDRPWVVDGEVVPRKVTQLSLAFDHRVCDGGPAAAFLRFVADCVEHPHDALADL
ncbi:dihydrolipoamide acetyltransferase family protein [Actinomadura hibisca]|uniref:dihydrolipoamide acetyltransferase family protein n=1 Tax=Actinomadura hibisca TaxID=68565 RepID=UPI000834654F|nr:dihydrolipoamide acetyltransferase family protein [Actinomadura hibisca]